MADWIILAGYTTGGALMLMMTFGIVFSALMPALDRWSKSFFISLFSLLLVYAVVVFVDAIFYTNPDLAAAERIVVLIEHVCFSALTPVPVFFLLHCCEEKIKDSTSFKVISALWTLFAAILIIAQFTDVFYRVSRDNQYTRGPLYALLLVPIAAIMAISIVSVIKRRKKLSKKYVVALLIYVLPMTLAIIIYMFATVDMIVVFVIVLCALTMFGLILSDSIEQNLRQQREIANQRASLMVLQMRPHFIYNTMMGIYYLCDREPAKAKQVTLDFTTYLRKNFTAIASEDAIPFNDELEHTRAYLAVEQAQFEDVLFVHFDTPHTMFRVPPLTLQPIVENAVKHGMRSSSNPIHISVVTCQNEKSSEITVEDDGPGFDSADNNEPHIALNNIRHRLELMCSGTLTISEREGGGTSVKVTIPKSSW